MAFIFFKSILPAISILFWLPWIIISIFSLYMKTCKNGHKSQIPTLSAVATFKPSNTVTFQWLRLWKCIQLISYFWHKQPPPKSLSINMGLTKLICLGGILNIPPKISIHKAGQHNWVIYDLFTPLERLTEDITHSRQSNWLFTWKRNTVHPIREPADLRMMSSKALHWSGLFGIGGCVVNAHR